MALKAIMLRREIERREAELEALREKDESLQTRESELEAAIAEVETDEQRDALNAEIDSFETERSAHTDAVSALENQIQELRGQLEAEEAKEPPAWNEYGWDDPAPQLPSLEVFPDSCTVEDFAQKVSSQHVIVAYGDFTEELRDFCRMMGIELVM